MNVTATFLGPVLAVVCCGLVLVGGNSGAYDGIHIRGYLLLTRLCLSWRMAMPEVCLQVVGAALRRRAQHWAVQRHDLERLDQRHRALAPHHAEHLLLAIARLAVI